MMLMMAIVMKSIVFVDEEDSSSSSSSASSSWSSSGLPLRLAGLWPLARKLGPLEKARCWRRRRLTATAWSTNSVIFSFVDAEEAWRPRDGVVVIVVVCIVVGV